MKQELSGEIVIVMKEKNTFYSDGDNCFLDESQMAKLPKDFWIVFSFFKVEIP